MKTGIYKDGQVQEDGSMITIKDLSGEEEIMIFLFDNETTAEAIKFLGKLSNGQ